MSEINGFNVNNSVLQSLSLPEEKPEQNSGNSLGQADFLRLLVTQLENQNPLEPQDGTEFVAQLAQFSVVQGIDKMNTNFNELSTSFQSSQAIQASALVGRTVMVNGGTGRLGEQGGMLGSVDVTQPVDDMLISIFDAQGLLVRQNVVGGQDRGDFRFAWDGLKDDGERAAPGVYRIDAFGLAGDETIRLPIAVSANVNSVTIGQSGGLTLNVDGVGPVGVSEVKEIL